MVERVAGCATTVILFPNACYSTSHLSSGRCILAAPSRAPHASNAHTHAPFSFRDQGRDISAR
jgi:hypothetical protein